MTLDEMAFVSCHEHHACRLLLCVKASLLGACVKHARICRQGNAKAASVIPTAWQERLFPRSGWFRVSAAGVPEPRLLEAVRVHCLPEQDLRSFLRRLSTCRNGEALTCGDSDIPAGLSQCLHSVIKARRAQFGLSGGHSNSIHETAAHAKSTYSSATLSNQQAASIVISGELQCLDKLEGYLSSKSPQALVEHSLSAWQRKRLCKHKGRALQQM